MTLFTSLLMPKARGMECLKIPGFTLCDYICQWPHFKRHLKWDKRTNTIVSLSVFYMGCRVDVAQVKGVLAVPAQLYLSVSHIISFNIFNNFMRGSPYIWKNKMHTHIYEICVYDLSVTVSLWLHGMGVHILWFASGCQMVISAVGRSLPSPLLETTAPCLSLCVPG